MRSTRIYIESPLQSGSSLVLPADRSHYLASVLRLKRDHVIHLFNESQGEFVAILTGVDRRQVTVDIAECLRKPETPSLRITLGLAVLRSDRMDFAIQKATELGVCNICPLNTHHGEVRFKRSSQLENKMRHWREVAVHASEQCQRLDVPKLEAPVDFPVWLGQDKDQPRLLLDPGGEYSLSDIPVDGYLTLATGPEGGFSEEEVELAQQEGFYPTAIGPRVLRAETAPLAALAVLQSRYGDL